jgi:hypothetical protein
VASSGKKRKTALEDELMSKDLKTLTEVSQQSQVLQRPKHDDFGQDVLASLREMPNEMAAWQKLKSRKYSIL